MDIAGTICSIIAAFTGIITVIFSYLMWRDNKRNLLKKIEKKERKINEINKCLFRTFGPDYSGRGSISSLEAKKHKLQSGSDYLNKLL